MPRIAIVFFSIAIINISVLSACSTAEMQRNLGNFGSAVQGALGDESGQGAALGAVAGGLAGALIGDDTKSALIGAAIGGVLGYAVGESLKQRRQQYQSDEAFYDAQIQGTNELNKQLAQNNRQLRRSVADDNKNIDRLVRQYSAGEVERNQLITAKRNVDSNRQEAQATLSKVQNELDNQNQVLREVERSGDERRASRLRKEVATLESEVGELEQTVDLMASQSATLGAYI